MSPPELPLLATLPPARCARVVVAAGHVAEVLDGPGIPEQVAYVDDGGTPLLLLGCSTPRPTGRLRLRVKAWPMLGDVVVLARAQEPITAERRRRVLDGLLDDHGRCLQRQEIPCPARLIALRVDGVTLLDADDAPLPIDLADYQQAEPGLFEAFGPPLMAHLADGHQTHLTDLVRRQRICADPLGVAPVRLDPEALLLRVIDVDGSRYERVRFPAPLPHPHCLGRVLQDMLRA